MTLGRVATALAAMTLCCGAAAGGDVEVYQRYRAEMRTPAGGTVNAYVVRARVVYPYAIDRVLDASHDRIHLSERVRDIEHEEVVGSECVQDRCALDLRVVIRDLEPLGQIAYEMDAEVERRRDGSVVVEWVKVRGTPIIRHLWGRMELRRVGSRSTEVDYHIAVGATLLTLDRLATKTANYLEIIGDVLAEDHAGHESLWRALGPERRADNPEPPVEACGG